MWNPMFLCAYVVQNLKPGTTNFPQKLLGVKAKSFNTTSSP